MLSIVSKQVELKTSNRFQANNQWYSDKMCWEASACLHILQASGGDSQRVQPQLHSVEQIQGVFVWHWWPTNLDTLSQGWMCWRSWFLCTSAWCGAVWNCLSHVRQGRKKLSLSQNHSAPQLHSIYSIQKIPNATSHLGSFKETPFDSSPPGSCQLRQAQEVPLQRCEKMASWSRGVMLRLGVSRCQLSQLPVELGIPVLTRCGSTRAMVTLVKVTKLVPFDSLCLDKPFSIIEL